MSSEAQKRVEIFRQHRQSGGSIEQALQAVADNMWGDCDDQDANVQGKKRRLNEYRDLLAAGFTRNHFHAWGKGSVDLRDAGINCAELLAVGWPKEHLEISFREKKVGASQTVEAALQEIVRNNHATSPLPRGRVRVPARVLRLAGCSIAELHNAGFSAVDLKQQGAWFEPEEQDAVDAEYGEEEFWKQMRLLTSTDSVPVTLEDVGKARGYYLEAVSHLVEHQTERETFIRDNAAGSTLTKMEKELKRRLDDPKLPGGGQGRIQAKLDEVKRHREQKRKDREAVETKRQDLLELVDKRIAHLRREVEFFTRKLKPMNAVLREERRIRAGKVEYHNYAMARNCYPLKNLSDDERRRAVSTIVDTLGDPSRIDFKSVAEPMPEFQETVVKRRVGSKKQWTWQPPQGQQPESLPPLEAVQLLDYKLEKLNWIVDDLRAEIELLQEVKRLAERKDALWRRVPRRLNYSVLLGLAKFATTEVRPLQVLAKAVRQIPSDAVKRRVGKGTVFKRRQTVGAVNFSLEFGLSGGAGEAETASATIGLSIALTGAVTVEDDRRVRAKVTLKLIPNFDVKFKLSGIGTILDLTASLGFTLTNQAFAFVDEKHFAHYLTFRIANLFRYTDQLMRLGTTALNSEFNPYDAQTRKLMDDEKARAALGESRYEQERIYYLTRLPVVKAHTPLKGKFIPEVDLGLESSVVGMSVGATAGYTPTVFRKQMLVIPGSRSELPAPEPALHYQGPRYHEYQARGDGDCAYHSLVFLLRHHDVRRMDQKVSVDRLRRRAANILEDKFRKKNDGDAFWALDTERFSGVGDFIRHTRPGMEDSSPKKKHWADLQVLAALALHYDVEIRVHVPGHTAIRLPPGIAVRPNLRVLHLVFRGGNHYNPLIEVDESAPAVRPEIVPPEVSRPNSPPVMFPADEPVLASLVKGDPAKLPPLPKFRPPEPSAPSSREVRRAQRADEQKHTPRIVTFFREGTCKFVTGRASITSWVDLGFEISKLVFDRNINPDNNGVYRNIKASGSLLQRTFAAPADPEAADPFDDAARSAIDPGNSGFGEVWASAVPPDNLGLDNLTKHLGPVSIDVTLGARYLEWNYVYEDKKWRKQYVRWNCTSGISVGVEAEVDVYTGVVAGLNFSAGVSKALAMHETLGVDTFSYIQTVFNGLKLRPNGVAQWQRFLVDNHRSFRRMFKRIGLKGNARAGSFNCNVYNSAVALEEVVKNNTRHWKDDPGRKWSKPKSDETTSCHFVADCQKAFAAGKLDGRWGLRSKGLPTPVRTFKSDNLATIQELCQSLTTLFYRATQVLQLNDERRYPYKRKTKYLLPPQGAIVFELSPHGQGFSVLRPPILPRIKEKVDGYVRYRDATDIFKNPELAQAESALQFYAHGFNVTIVFWLRNDRKQVRVSARWPDGEKALAEVVLGLAADCARKRKYNLDAFEELVKMHPKLADGFKLWIKKLRENKHGYPDTVAGMELVKENTIVPQIVLNDAHQPVASDSSSPDAQPAILLPERLRPVASGDQPELEGDTTPLEPEEKWIRKAHQIWDGWLAAEEKAGRLNRPDGTGPADAFELVLQQVRGPFPGYDDDLYFLLNTPLLVDTRPLPEWELPPPKAGDDLPVALPPGITYLMLSSSDNANDKRGRFHPSIPDQRQHLVALTDLGIVKKELTILSESLDPNLELLVVNQAHGGIGEFTQKRWSTNDLKANLVQPLLDNGVRARIIVLDYCLSASMLPAFTNLCTDDGRIICNMYSLTSLVVDTDRWGVIKDDLINRDGPGIWAKLEERMKELTAVATGQGNVLPIREGYSETEIASLLKQVPQARDHISIIRYLKKIFDAFDNHEEALHKTRQPQSEDLGALYNVLKSLRENANLGGKERAILEPLPATASGCEPGLYREIRRRLALRLIEVAQRPDYGINETGDLSTKQLFSYEDPTGLGNTVWKNTSEIMAKAGGLTICPSVFAIYSRATQTVTFDSELKIPLDDAIGTRLEAVEPNSRNDISAVLDCLKGINLDRRTKHLQAG